jgi:cholesterol transport system auxiliary component
MNRLHHLATLFVALFASGCVSLLPETAPPKPRYHIATPDAAALSGEMIDWSLVVEDPRTTRVYDSVKVAVATAPGKIEYFAGAEWADRAPRLFQTALVQTFEDSGRVLSVGDRTAVPVGDLVLQTDIRHLELDVQGEKAAKVSIYARISDGKGNIYAAQKFTSSSPASSERPDAVIAAFDGAFAEVISEIVAWTYEEGNRVRSAKS